MLSKKLRTGRMRKQYIPGQAVSLPSLRSGIESIVTGAQSLSACGSLGCFCVLIYTVWRIIFVGKIFVLFVWKADLDEIFTPRKPTVTHPIHAVRVVTHELNSPLFKFNEIFIPRSNFIAIAFIERLSSGGRVCYGRFHCS